eukprot:3880258-Pleurochrysis_carterae.AAC.3
MLKWRCLPDESVETLDSRGLSACGALLGSSRTAPEQMAPTVRLRFLWLKEDEDVRTRSAPGLCFGACTNSEAEASLAFGADISTVKSSLT